MVPRANLRAFEPLDALPVAERERWRAYVEAGAGISRQEAAAVEDAASASRLLTGRRRLGPEAALIRRAGSRILVCPLQLDLRAAAALRELRLEMPDEVIGALVPDDGAVAELEILSASGATPHILDASWAVPLAWFVAFDPSERHLVDPPEGSGPRLTYLTTAVPAAARLERAIDVVEATLVDGDDVLAMLADVAAWLDSFDEDSLIELDYGRVAGLFTRGELERDRTCEEIWAAIDALADGDALAAAAHYGVVRGRWADVRQKSHAS